MQPTVERTRCVVDDLAAVHYYVDDLEASCDFFVGALDLREIARSGEALESQTQERSVAFELGSSALVVTAPLHATSSAGRFLGRHVEGIGRLSFRVPDVRHAFETLVQRGATAFAEPCRPESDVFGGESFEVATPVDDCRFSFVSTRWSRGETLPGFVPTTGPSPDPGRGSRGFVGIDHVTINFITIEPAILWFEKVLGLQRFWSIDLHTGDPGPEAREGSGLRSVVMADPGGRIKIAHNEPRAPNFAGSQIFEFCERHRGSGVQHIALVVPDILEAVTRLRAKGVRFQSAPSAYYQTLSSQPWLPAVREQVDDLQKHEILLDGSGEQAYLLQVFMVPGGKFGRWESNTPFFLELIQREGCSGFGEGNFRALFESIESTECNARQVAQ